MSLIARATPTLLEGKFEIADPLNTVRPSLFPVGQRAFFFGVARSRIRHLLPPSRLRRFCVDR